MRKISVILLLLFLNNAFSQDTICKGIWIFTNNKEKAPYLFITDNKVKCYFGKENGFGKRWYEFYEPVNNSWNIDSIPIPEISGIALTITAAAEDSSGNIWFGTSSYNEDFKICNYCDNTSYESISALYKYSNNKLEYYSLPQIPELYDRYDSNYHYISHIAIDKFNNIWITARFLYYYYDNPFCGDCYHDSVHLLKFDGVNWKLFDKNTLKLKDSISFKRVYADKKGNVWLGSSLGMICLNNDTIKEIYPSTGLLGIDKNDDLVYYYNRHIGYYDGTNWNLKDSLKYVFETSIKFDNENNLWAIISNNRRDTFRLMKYDKSKFMYYDTCFYGYNQKTMPVSMGIDKYNNKWFNIINLEDIDLHGVLVFNENGIVTDITKRKSNNFNLLQISPNPFTDRIQISIDRADSKASFYQIGIYDLTGREIKNFNYKDIPQTGNIAIECPDLTCGIYIIRLQTDKAVYAGKLIKK